MVDWQTVLSTFTTLDVASKYVKGYLEQIKDAAVREKLTEILNTIIPLQAQVMSLYEVNLTLIQERNDLEAKLREIEDWTKETKDYEPNEIRPGIIVYSKKPQGEYTGPIMHLCPNCLNVHRRKSIIQLGDEDSSGNKQFICPNCTFKFIMLSEHQNPPQAPPSPKAWT